MKVTHLTAVNYVRQPWKNGGGTTTELARDQTGDRLLWRLSIADVDRSGPFSDFTGYRRIIMLLEGRGMALSFDAMQPVVLDRHYRPFAFDGAWRTDCRLLDGPVRDMNLIFDDARIAASVDIWTPAGVVPVERAGIDWTLLLAIDGSFRIDVGGSTTMLGRGEMLRIDGAQGSVISTTARDAHSVLALMNLARRR